MRLKINLFPVKLLAVAAVILTLQSCKHKQGIWQNADMNAGKRSDFHDMNKRVLDGLKSNQYLALQADMSREMLDNSEMIRTVEAMSIFMKHDSFELKNEFYVCSPPETTVTLGDRKSGINNFDVNFRSVADEMYLAFFTSKKPREKWMLTAVYAKFDYGWKLRDITLNPYTVEGKTAPELYQLAKQKYSKGYLIDAVDLMDLSRMCSLPADEWQYKISSEMSAFMIKTISEANAKYTFPYIMAQVKTHPQIIRVYNQKTPEGNFPMVYYLSKISLKDTTAVKKENEEINKTIGTIMPGINIDKKYLYYAAFNQRPNPKISVNHFDMVQRLK